MANTDAAYGFRPVMKKGGGEVAINAYAPQGYAIASAYGTTINAGDPVVLTGSASADGRPTIQIATPGTVTGVFKGCQYVDSNGMVQFSKSWPASTVATNVVADVFDDPNTIFSIQADEDIVAADIGAKADFVAGAGVNGESRYELDSSTVTSGDGLMILGVDASISPNALGENYTKVLVLFREHSFGPALTVA